MKVTKRENYLILEDDKNDVLGFSNYLANHAHEKFRDENVIIDILKYGQLSLEELLSFLQLSNKHRGNKKSFVLVNDTINIDQVPEELMVVPTMQEAEDVIQMEEIERDLGALDDL